MPLCTYLYFDGDCAAAFDFYKSVFGGDFTSKASWGDAPPDMGVPDGQKDKLMHVSLAIGDGLLMGCDVVEGFGEKPVTGGFALSYMPDSRDEADRAFGELTEGGEVKMPMQDMFWGAYFGQGTDRFGIEWMVNVESQGA
jgi:PhnB protein